MHDPICLETLWWLTLVKNQSFLHPNMLRATIDCFVSTSGLPIPRHSCSIRPHPIWVLPLSWAKEVPFIFSKVCFLCISWEFDMLEQEKHAHAHITIWSKYRQLDILKGYFSICQHMYQVIPMDQTCRYPLLEWLMQGMVLMLLGYKGSRRLVPHRWGETWSQVGAQSLFCPPLSRVKSKIEWETMENSSLLIKGQKRRERRKLKARVKEKSRCLKCLQWSGCPFYPCFLVVSVVALHGFDWFLWRLFYTLVHASPYPPDSLFI